MTTATVWAIIGGLGAGVAGILLHVWLVRRNPVWLGGIIPLLYLGLVIGFPASEQWSVAEIIGNAAITVLLLLQWWGGQEERQRRRGDRTHP